MIFNSRDRNRLYLHTEEIETNISTTDTCCQFNQIINQNSALPPYISFFVNKTIQRLGLENLIQTREKLNSNFTKIKQIPDMSIRKMLLQAMVDSLKEKVLIMDHINKIARRLIEERNTPEQFAETLCDNFCQDNEGQLDNLQEYYGKLNDNIIETKQDIISKHVSSLKHQDVIKKKEYELICKLKEIEYKQSSCTKSYTQLTHKKKGIFRIFG